MKKFKKILSILLVLVMVFSLAACGKKNDKTEDNNTTTTDEGKDTDTTDAVTEAPTEEGPNYEELLAEVIPTETVTLNVYTQLANYSGEQIGWFAQVLKEKFNVVLNIINEGDGTFVTRMESGDLGDIVVFGNDSDQYIQAIEAGMLFDWEEDGLIEDYGPYILENMPNALEKNKKLSPDGKLYGYGFAVGTSTKDRQAFFYRPDIRWDLYKELGYPEVNTLEDFVDVLDDMVKLQPTSDTGGKTYGVSLFPDWDGNMVMMVKSTAALYGWDEFGFGLYDVENQVYEDALKEGGMYIRMLKFYNTLYQRGLLDPDSMTQTYSDMSEAYQTGAAFFNIFDWMGSGTYNTPEHKESGKAMMPLAANDQENLVYGLNINGGNRVWTIGSKSAYPELCMAIINWLSTPEGKMITDYGPKGVTWDYDAEGKPYLTEIGETVMSDKETELTGDYSGKFVDGESKINNETWADDATNLDTSNGDTYNYNFWENRLSRPVSEIEEDWRTFTGALDVNEYLENSDKMAISLGTSYSESPKSDELMTTWKQVAEAIKSYSWQAIYAKTDAEFDSIVEEMRAKAYDYGYEECVEFQENEAAIRKALEDAVKAQ